MNTNFIAGREKYLERVRNGMVVKVKRPSLKKAILAKCKDCSCDYVDGRLDCEMKSCVLYYWMPYGKLRKKRDELSEIINQ